jgi:alpha-amylase
MSRDGKLRQVFCYGLMVMLLPIQGAQAEDTSPPAILQWFGAKHEIIEARIPDAFMAGYGIVLLPPVGRAGSDGDGDSVGYDPFDRFDLGTAAHPTHYGTEEAVRRIARLLHRAAMDLHLDFIINHCGYQNRQDPAFRKAGDFPGFVVDINGDNKGDFHNRNASGDIESQVFGADIDHSTNYRFVRSPVPGEAMNIPAGTVPAFGRLADVPREENRRFYPDNGLNPIFLFDPQTGEQGIKVFPFNLDTPLKGDPVPENAMGYLMRNAQWLVQVIGADGFRIDAAKHVSQDALRNFDRAIYRANPRPLLDGSTKHVFCYGETKDRKIDVLKPYVVKTINPGDPGRIGANRDTLDFAFFDNVKENLTDNGFGNDWMKVRQCSLDANDDGFQNGSAGVKFIASHDDDGPALSNVALAHMLLLPGNAIVYYHAEQLNDPGFVKRGRGDALGGLFGSRLTRLVTIRNTHGRGDYRERLVEKELFAYERSGSAVVLMSNRSDAGFDSRSIKVDLTPGTRLIELTGNAEDAKVDPNDDLPSLVEVNGDRTINIRFPRNSAANGNKHNSGYLIYGLATPQAPQGIVLSPVDHVEPAEVPTAATNGTARLTEIPVIKSATLTVRVKLVPVNLIGSVRDADADGDNALLRIDGGLDVNGNGSVDFRTPGSVTYGFENFTGKHSPLTSGSDGEFVQTIDMTKLSNGLHFVEVRAFRRRTDGGPAVYTTLKKVFRVDR